MSRAIGVIGMHRSGTSMLAGCLEQHGVYFGDDMLPANNENPLGFWESQETLRIHDKILKLLGVNWKITTPLPDGWEDSTGLKQQIIYLTNHINKLNENPLWGFKDPRTCLLLPIWKRILNDIGVELSTVYIVRHPADVMLSLGKRKVDKDVAYNIWLNYNISAINNINYDNTMFVSYEKILNDESELRRIVTGLGIEYDESVDPISDKNLRRNINDGEELPDKVQEVYSMLLDKC